MQVLGGNSEIQISGIKDVYSGYAETEVEIGRTGTYSATYVDVTYYSGLGLPTTRYWFDANGTIRIPIGDLVRAYIDEGYALGNVTIFTAVDDVDGTTANCNINVNAGIIPILPDEDIFPPRRCLPMPLGGALVDTTAFCAAGHIMYTISHRYNGVWTTPVTKYTDGQYIDFTLANNAGDVVKVGDWICEVTHDCVRSCVLEWSADRSDKKKQWRFEVVSVTRETTDTRETEGVGVLRGTFNPTKKNWKLSAKLIVRDLAVDEIAWFDELVTGSDVKIKEWRNVYYGLDSLLTYSGSEQSVQITDKKSTRAFGLIGTADLVFSMDVLNVKTY